MQKFNPWVQISVSPRTGKIEAAYIRLRDGVTHETRDADDAGNAFADYGADGVLLGIEILAPCTASALDRITRDEPEPYRSVSRYTPHELVCP